MGKLRPKTLKTSTKTRPAVICRCSPTAASSRRNTTLAAWTGLQSAQIVGKRLRDLLTVGSRIFYETHYAPLLALQGYFNEVSVDLKTASGDKLPVFANATERRDADGRLLFTRLTIFKAAERRRYEQQLVDARGG